MLNYLIRRDLYAAWELTFGAMLVMSVVGPAIATFACLRRPPFQWRTWRSSAWVAWRTGVVVCVASTLFGVGIVQLLSNLIAGYQPLDMQSVTTICLLGYLLAFGVAYRRTVRHLATIAEPEKDSRRFAFSLRTLILVQVAIIVAIGLWVANRHPFHVLKMQQLAQQHQIDEQRMEAQVMQRLQQPGWHAVVSSNPRRLQLFTQGSDLPGFSEQTLDRITREDGLSLIEVRSDQLTDLGVSKLAEHRDLKFLTLKSDSISDSCFAAFAGHPSLLALRVDSNNLTDEVFQQLQQIPKLKEVHLTLPMGTEAAINSYRQTKPGVKVTITTTTP
ncbi:hypothetical protein [Anatilimnocola floriformis]|uniref:hypothetical protein n=1 Tax=Anatilimnocola floriformis TaxID=2948575 RepID=UPI0020C530FC|nr:hypothetical protein [Anatilimnocola floriformis]